MAEHPKYENPVRLRRALVLGGGGAAGNAWEIGVLAGLLDGGLDVTGADLVVGTSAGATAAAQITSAPLAELLALTVAAPAAAATSGSAPVRTDADHIGRMSRIIAAADDAADMRRRMGAAALELEAAAGNDASSRWRETVAARLPSPLWPDRRVLVPAVDARTAEPVVFDRYSGVDLVDAVAASTSPYLPYRIGDDRYLDGGYRRNENADLAEGHERVLVLSPFGGRSLHPPAWRMQLAAQVDELRAAGSTVEVVVPDATALAAFGGSVMNPLARPPAARAGQAQGRALADQLGELWR